MGDNSLEVTDYSKLEENLEEEMLDNLGEEVTSSLLSIEKGIQDLADNLEIHFTDDALQESTLNSEPEEISRTRTGSGEEDRKHVDDIILMLNDNHSESSEEHFNNPSFDELESLSAKKEKSRRSYEGVEEDDEESGEFNKKIFELINSMKSRSSTIVLDDEWDNDDDSGYIMMTLTENEFFDYEDKNAALLVAKQNSARDAHRNDRSSSGGHAKVDIVEEDHTLELEERFDREFVNDEAAKQTEPKRLSAGERRRSEIMGQHRFLGVDGMHCFFNLKIIFEPYKTGFEESKDLKHPKGTILAGRYEVYDVLGSAAFSTALQCIDLAAEEDEPQWVCLKVIKNNKDYFDQSLDEIKLLQYINSRGEPDEHHVLRLIDFFYCKEHLFIVSELLKENLYEFGRYIKENDLEFYYSLPRLKRISKQVLEALAFIHSLKLIHCDVKPENIVIKSFSRCEIKLIDFGSSCFTTDHLTTYIQSRSYRAPEVILGHTYDSRIDIWSVGAVIAELYTGYVLFQNDSVPTMLSRITGILGPFPETVLSNGRDTGKYFTLSNIVYERDDDGSFHLIFPKKTNLRSRLHFSVQPEDHSEDENLFVDFVRTLLDLDPAKRVTASEALKHPWLKDADTVKFSEYIIGQPAAAKESQDKLAPDANYLSGYDIGEPVDEEAEIFEEENFQEFGEDCELASSHSSETEDKYKSRPSTESHSRGSESN